MKTEYYTMIGVIISIASLALGYYVATANARRLRTTDAKADGAMMQKLEQISTNLGELKQSIDSIRQDYKVDHDEITSLRVTIEILRSELQEIKKRCYGSDK